MKDMEQQGNGVLKSEHGEITGFYGQQNNKQLLNT